MSTELTVVQKKHPYNLPPLFGGLTLKQNSFVDNWLRTQNGIQSARDAGFQGDDQVLAVTASRLLKSAKVQLEIKRRLGTNIADSTEVLERLTQHARGDLTDILDENGELNLKQARKRGTSKLLKKLKIKRRYEKDAEGNLQPVVEHEYEIHDPQAALEKLGRFHKLFTDRVETETNLSDSDLQRILGSVCAILDEAKRRQEEKLLAESNESNLTR